MTFNADAISYKIEVANEEIKNYLNGSKDLKPREKELIKTFESEKKTLNGLLEEYHQLENFWPKDIEVKIERSWEKFDGAHRQLKALSKEYTI